MVISRITPFLGFLRDLSVLTPGEARGLQVFGLCGAPRRSKISYRTLDEALATRDLVVSEVSAHGSFQSLWVMNRGDSMVLLRAGERLPGVRQPWTLKMSFLVVPQATEKVQPGCIEQEARGEQAGGPPLPSSP